MAKHQVLFCPFCHESFEELASCPEHELSLISFEQLRSRATTDDADQADQDGEQADEQALVPLDDRALGALDLRHGRGLVALGALLNATALALGLIQLEGAPMLRTFELARARPSLWTLGLVSFTVLYALSRRRTLRELRGLRLLVPLLALLSPATVAWVLWRLSAASDVQPAFGPAVYLVALASLSMLGGGARLGAATPVSTRA